MTFLSKKKIIIFVPAYNVEKKIYSVINLTIRDFICNDINKIMTYFILLFIG